MLEHWLCSIHELICLLSLENFLYGFVVPILPYILEIRNHVDPTDTQRLIYQILTLYGATAVAGFLLQLTGYWPTWSVVLVILALDITMRPVMIENSKNNVNSTDNSYQMSITKCGILTVPQLWSMSCSLSIREYLVLKEATHAATRFPMWASQRASSLGRFCQEPWPMPWDIIGWIQYYVGSSLVSIVLHGQFTLEDADYWFQRVSACLHRHVYSIV